MTPRPCLKCHRLTDGSYCPGCQPRNGSTRSWRQIRRQVLQRDAYTCHYCSGVANTVDHRVPVTYGGTDDPSNLVAACSRCNRRKGSS